VKRVGPVMVTWQIDWIGSLTKSAPNSLITVKSEKLTTLCDSYKS